MYSLHRCRWDGITYSFRPDNEQQNQFGLFFQIQSGWRGRSQRNEQKCGHIYTHSYSFKNHAGPPNSFILTVSEWVRERDIERALKDLHLALDWENKWHSFPSKRFGRLSSQTIAREYAKVCSYPCRGFQTLSRFLSNNLCGETNEKE